MRKHKVVDWRDAALQEAFRETSVNGTKGAIVAAFLRNVPDCALATAVCSRTALTGFLSRRLRSVRSLLLGSVGVFIETLGQSTLQMGWFAAEWEGYPIELAVEPGLIPQAQVVVKAATAELASDVIEALIRFDQQPAGRTIRWSSHWQDAPDIDAELGTVTWDDIILPQDTIESLRGLVDGFIAQRDIFRSLGFPWRRGILLVGPPGTGKTMVCKAAAAATPELPFLYVRDLRAIQGDPIQHIFKRARRLAPCLLAFEDIDSLVTERTRSVFLNELDGFQSNEGLLIIASSNHPGKVDEALLKRPSRFDRVFHLGLPAYQERRRYCEWFLSRSQIAGHVAPSLDRDALGRRVAEKTDGFTPAYLKEAFLSAALERAQDNTTSLDAEFADAVLSQVDELRVHLNKMRDPAALADMSRQEPIGLRQRVVAAKEREEPEE